MSPSSTPARRRRGPPAAPATGDLSSAASVASVASVSSDTALAKPDSTAKPADTTTPLALAARHASPLLLLAVLAASFPGLVGGAPTRETGGATLADASTGIGALVGLFLATTVVQVAAAVVGLPPAGSDAEAQKKRRARKDTRKPNVIVTTTLSLVLTALATPLVHAILVLFGAPFLAHVPSTLLCAAILAVLGLFPVVYTRGTDSGGWLALVTGDVFAGTTALDAADATAAAGLWGTALGAWLGAVPIPLDWDRPWQRWPVTIVVGACVGHAVGRLLAGAVAQRR